MSCLGGKLPLAPQRHTLTLAQILVWKVAKGLASKCISINRFTLTSFIGTPNYVRCHLVAWALLWWTSPKDFLHNLEFTTLMYTSRPVMLTLAWHVALCCVALLSSAVLCFRLGDFNYEVSPRITYTENNDKCGFKESIYSYTFLQAIPFIYGRAQGQDN